MPTQRVVQHQAGVQTELAAAVVHLLLVLADVAQVQGGVGEEGAAERRASLRDLLQPVDGKKRRDLLVRDEVEFASERPLTLW